MATDLTALTAKVKAAITATTEKGLDLSTPKDEFSLLPAIAFAFGSANDKADQFWHDRRILAISGSENLDLTAGAAVKLVNAYGTEITFASVKAILIWNSSDQTSTAPAHTANETAIMNIGGHATEAFPGPFNATTDELKLDPGDIFVITKHKAGWTVVGASDLLEITNGAVAELMYDIVLIGVSA